MSRCPPGSNSQGHFQARANPLVLGEVLVQLDISPHLPAMIDTGNVKLGRRDLGEI